VGSPREALNLFTGPIHPRNVATANARHQTVTDTYRDYRHGSQHKDLTLSALEFIRWSSSGDNRRKRDIEAARLIFISSGRAMELLGALRICPFGGMCCPLRVRKVMI
jgi:hypothetical protein